MKSLSFVSTLVSLFTCAIRASVAYAVETAPTVGMAPWGRLRNTPFTVENVPSSGTGKATLKLERYAQTLLTAIVKFGGTTFTYSHITEWRLMLGQKTISKGTGAHQRLINKLLGEVEDASFLTIDFSDPRQKLTAAELIGGIDLSKLPPGQLQFEFDISGATSPQMDVLLYWGPPQDNDLIVRQLQYSDALSVVASVGGNNLGLDFGGADLFRFMMIYGGSDWVGTSATATAGSGNTGNGTFGSVTVSAGAKRGNHRIMILEPGSNVGTFMHIDPDGVLVGSGVVASAYSGGGLAFTIADGATDFVSGDNWTIPVGATTQGNITRMEVRKNNLPVWDRSCLENRFEQARYGLVPQSKMFAVDFVQDRSLDGRLITDRAQGPIEIKAWATATDTYTAYAQVLMPASSI